jgi:hypothetical protein
MRLRWISALRYIECTDTPGSHRCSRRMPGHFMSCCEPFFPAVWGATNRFPPAESNTAQLQGLVWTYVSVSPLEGPGFNSVFTTFMANYGRVFSRHESRGCAEAFVRWRLRQTFCWACYDTGGIVFLSNAGVISIVSTILFQNREFRRLVPFKQELRTLSTLISAGALFMSTVSIGTDSCYVKYVQ